MKNDVRRKTGERIIFTERDINVSLVDFRIGCCRPDYEWHIRTGFNTLVNCGREKPELNYESLKLRIEDHLRQSYDQIQQDIS